MKIYILDNYDSFTFNLKHYFEALDCAVIVERNDEVTFSKIEISDAIILSPGPGLPKDAGLLMEVIERYFNLKPILGVCLGHQALWEYKGGQLYNLDQVFHGKKHPITHNKKGLFNNISSPMNVGLYHSWAIKLNQQKNLVITSSSKEGVAMSFQHKSLPVFGIQFHPESILTDDGLELLKNFKTIIEK